MIITNVWSSFFAASLRGVPSCSMWCVHTSNFPRHSSLKWTRSWRGGQARLWYGCRTPRTSCWVPIMTGGRFSFIKRVSFVSCFKTPPFSELFTHFSSLFTLIIYCTLRWLVHVVRMKEFFLLFCFLRSLCKSKINPSGIVSMAECCCYCEFLGCVWKCWNMNNLRPSVAALEK